MPAATERCPKCHHPRARGTFRCACGHTFEYVANLRERSRRSPELDAVLVVLTVMAVITGYLAVPADPDHAGVGALLVLAGLFAAVASIANIHWFFAISRARLLSAVLGRSGARMLYTVLGGGLVGAGAQLLLAS